MRPRTATRLTALGAILAVAILTAGCLVKDTTETLCLQPDGSVRWVALEHNIHATGDTPADRQREEDEFLASVRAGTHPVALAFRALDAEDVRTQVVSADWPFAVRTEARFSDIAHLWQTCLDRAGLHAQSILRHDGARTTWTIVVDASEETQSSESDLDESVSSLFAGDQPPIVVIQHGQFVDAVGFDISDDGRVAKLKDLSGRDWNKEPRLELSLTWVAAESTNPGQKQAGWR